MYFKNSDDVVAKIKTPTIKIKESKKDFYETGLPLLPNPVITRWATWLRAALHCNEYFSAVCTIVNNWTGGQLFVSRAKEAVNVENLVPDLVRIKQCRTLAANVEFLEASDCTMTEASKLLKNMQFHHNPPQFKFTPRNDYSTLI